MLRNLTVLGLVLMASSAFANGTCSDRLVALKGDAMASQLPNDATLNMAKNAFAHFTAETNREPEIKKYSAYYNISYGQVTGYKIVIGSKGDLKSTQIAYYLDNGKKMVYATSNDKSRSTYWICETPKVKKTVDLQ